MSKQLPFDSAQIQAIAEKWPTPFYLYDEAGIRQTARQMRGAFDWTNFRNYFAVKATPNPHLLKILIEEGMGADCSSGAELEISRRVGLAGEDIMFTSNNTMAKDYQFARDLGAIINLDDFNYIDYLDKNVGVPELVCCRFNPGEMKAGNVIIGNPVEAKFGFTRQQLLDGYRKLKELGVKEFGLHTMVASNELSVDFHLETAGLLFDIAAELHADQGISLKFVNLGGGVGVPYEPDQTAFAWEDFGNRLGQLYQQKIVDKGIPEFQVVMENGRCVTGPHGYLVTQVTHRKKTYRDYVGVDATMANLMRPGMYGSYHRISAIGNDSTDLSPVDVVGSLCENNDKFAIQREMPNVQAGDYLAICDAGAHGHSMGFQYNGKLRSAELLLRPDGEVVEIRRAETLEDYFGTLNFESIFEPANA